MPSMPLKSITYVQKSNCHDRSHEFVPHRLGPKFLRSQPAISSVADFSDWFRV